MKTVLIKLENAFYIHNNDEFDSFRNEGRIPINIGFGLSLLDYEVNIVYPGWNIVHYKETVNNIKLSKFPLYKKYDIFLTFSDFSISSDIKFDKLISIVYEKSHINRTKDYIKLTGIKVNFATTYKDLVEHMKKTIGENVLYIPPLYPISSIDTKFINCSFDPKYPELKVFLIYTSWSQNTTIGGNRFIYHEQLIINHLKNKGYNLNLTILIEKRGIDCQITHDNITYIYSNESNYKKILNLILSNDICITNGASVFPGNCMTDIVTLGKPLLYICDGRLGIETESNVNLIYKVKNNNIIYIQESDEQCISKVDILINNPIEMCKKYKEIHKDQEFDTWKDIVKNIF